MSHTLKPSVLALSSGTRNAGRKKPNARSGPLSAVRTFPLFLLLSACGGFGGGTVLDSCALLLQLGPIRTQNIIERGTDEWDALIATAEGRLSIITDYRDIVTTGTSIQLDTVNTTIEEECKIEPERID